MRKPKHWMVVTMAAAIAFVLGAATAVVAGGPPPVTGSGTDITRVKTISQSEQFVTFSTAGVDVPDASVRILVSGNPALIVARFQADAFCDGFDLAACLVRIVVDDGVTETVMPPGQAVFLEAPSIFGFSQTRSMERSITVGPGDYQVTVQAAVTDADDTFTLTRYHLTVERIV